MELIAAWGDLATLLSFIFQAVEQAQHRGSLLDAFVELEHHLRCPAHLQASAQFTTQVAARRLQPFEHLVAVVLFPELCDRFSTKC